MQKSVRYYLRENVFITTSGVFDHAVLDCARAGLGIDNILFSADDPFRDNFEAVDFLNSAKLSPEDREKLAHGNAERLLKLSSEAHSRPRSRRSFRSSLNAFKARAKSKLGRMVLSFLVK
jgi:hypothetical protein